MKVKVFRVFSFLLLVSWMGLIFWFSSKNSTESSATSGGLLNWLINIFYRDFDLLTEAKQTAFLTVATVWIRKGAHAFIYMILGVFAFLNVASLRKIRLLVRLFMGWGFCILYAVSDEWHQTFISGRSGEIRDIIIDSLGALIGLLFCLFFVGLFSRIYSKVSFIKKNERVTFDGVEHLDMSDNDIFDKQNEISEDLRQLQIANERLIAQLEQANKANEALKREIEQIKENESSADEKKQDFSSVNNVDDNTAEQEKTTVKEVVLDPDSEYAAKIIGKIVRLGAEYSNELSYGGEVKYKELINLILGRTEVEKANILDIILSDAPSEDKKQMIDSCEAAAAEYFKSVMAQKI